MSKNNFRYLIYIILLIPVFMFRDYTPSNELKYISIVEETLRNGNWFTFYNHGEIYADKPPLFFWLIMGSKLLTGGYHMWIIGLFSILPAAGIMAVMDKWFHNSNTGHNQTVSNLLLLTTVMFMGATLVARMDMLMAFFIVLSLYTFFKIYKNENMKCEKWLLPVYIFLAIFSKGPVGFIIPILSIYAFLLVKSKIHYAKHCFGWKQWAVLAGLCAVWFWCIYAEGGSEYLNNILFRQTVGRGVNSFHHKEPVWYYLPRIFLTFAPWTIIYIVLIYKEIRKKRLLTELQQFLVVIIVINLVFLSLVSSKLDIYLLPAYPFFVYLCSSLIPGNESSLSVKIGTGIPAFIFTMVFPAFLIIKYYIPPITGILPYIGTGLMSAGGFSALAMLIRNRTENAILSISGSLLAGIFVCSFAIPQINSYIGFRDMAEAAKKKAEQEQILQYAYYTFNTAPNMDIFLGKSPQYIGSVEQLDSLDAQSKQTIVFFRQREIDRNDMLHEWVSSKQADWSVGEYCWYTVGGEK